MTLIFGSSISSFNSFVTGKGSPSQFQADVNHLVLYFVYLFVGRFVIGYVATLCICIAAARTTNSLRKAFLESLLRQDVSHFDMPDNGSAATQVTTSKHFRIMTWLPLTWYLRWFSSQPRYCWKTVFFRHRNITFLLSIHCCTCCPVEACSHNNERSTSNCFGNGRLFSNWCPYRSPSCMYAESFARAISLTCIPV